MTEPARCGQPTREEAASFRCAASGGGFGRPYSCRTRTDVTAGLPRHARPAAIGPCRAPEVLGRLPGGRRCHPAALRDRGQRDRPLGQWRTRRHLHRPRKPRARRSRPGRGAGRRERLARRHHGSASHPHGLYLLLTLASVSGTDRLRTACPTSRLPVAQLGNRQHGELERFRGNAPSASCLKKSAAQPNARRFHRDVICLRRFERPHGRIERRLPVPQ